MTSTSATYDTSCFTYTPRRPDSPHSSVDNALIADSAASVFSASNHVPKNSNIPNCKSNEDSLGKDEKNCQTSHRKKGVKYRGRTICKACYEFYQKNLEVKNTLICKDDSVLCDITQLSKDHTDFPCGKYVANIEWIIFKGLF